MLGDGPSRKLLAIQWAKAAGLQGMRSIGPQICMDRNKDVHLQSGPGQGPTTMIKKVERGEKGVRFMCVSTHI